jgi:hypothetical protein
VRGLNFLSLSQDLSISNDLNLGLHDFGWDPQSAKEGCLLRVQACGARSDPDISRGYSTDFGWSLSGFLINDLLDFAEVSIRENKASVAFQQTDYLLQFLAFMPGILSLKEVFIFFLGFLHFMIKACFHQCLEINE